MASLLSSLDHFDKRISGFIHNAAIKPFFLEFIIFPFAFFHSPLVLPAILGLIYFVFAEYKKLENKD